MKAFHLPRAVGESRSSYVARLHAAIIDAAQKPNTAYRGKMPVLVLDPFELELLLLDAFVGYDAPSHVHVTPERRE